VEEEEQPLVKLLPTKKEEELSIDSKKQKKGAYKIKDLLFLARWLPLY
jgi:hypothetical protein